MKGQDKDALDQGVEVEGREGVTPRARSSRLEPEVSVSVGGVPVGLWKSL